MAQFLPNVKNIFKLIEENKDRLATERARNSLENQDSTQKLSRQNSHVRLSGLCSPQKYAKP